MQLSISGVTMSTTIGPGGIRWWHIMCLSYWDKKKESVEYEEFCVYFP